MKKLKTIFVFLVLLSFTFTVFAQINVIPKIGVNTVKLRNDVEEYTLEGSTGYNVGIDFRFGEDFIVQPGIHYYKLKTDLEDIGDNPVLNVGNFSNTSIRIPLMIGTGIGANEKFQIRFLAGGLAAFRMNVKSDDFEFFDDKDNFKPATFSAIGGVGLDIFSLAIGITYEYGLSDILDNGNGTQNNIASLTVGYVF